MRYGNPHSLRSNILQEVAASVYSQLGQGGLEEGVGVVAVDHLSFALLGFRGGGHGERGGGGVWRLPLDQQLPLALDVLPLLVDALLLPAEGGGQGGEGNGSIGKRSRK